MRDGCGVPPQTTTGRSTRRLFVSRRALMQLLGSASGARLPHRGDGIDQGLWRVPNRRKADLTHLRPPLQPQPTPLLLSPSLSLSLPLSPNLRTTIRNYLAFLTRFLYGDLLSACLAARSEDRMTAPTFPSAQSHTAADASWEPGQSGDPWPPPCPPTGQGRNTPQPPGAAYGCSTKSWATKSCLRKHPLAGTSRILILP